MYLLYALRNIVGNHSFFTKCPYASALSLYFIFFSRGTGAKSNIVYYLFLLQSFQVEIFYWNSSILFSKNLLFDRLSQSKRNHHTIFIPRALQQLIVDDKPINLVSFCIKMN